MVAMEGGKGIRLGTATLGIFPYTWMLPFLSLSDGRNVFDDGRNMIVL